MPPTFPYAYLLHPTLPEKRAQGLRCISWRCRRKGDTEHARCQTCRSRLYRMAHPERYAYGNLRSSARKRHIPFDLSFEDFMEFCRGNGYIEGRGKAPDSLTIDRISRSLPYQKGNLRILAYEANVNHSCEMQPDEGL